jgi:GNAT superfamily N-acetyltransferase
MMIEVRQALTADLTHVAQIIEEAAEWLEEIGSPLWKDDELNQDTMRSDIEAGLFFIGYCDGNPGGTIRYQQEDKLFWPEMNTGDAAYVHRIAVLRKYSGGKLSRALIDWAAARAKTEGKDFLRLDCESGRLRLRAVYEGFGFIYHSDRQVGPYHVARYQRPL